MVAKRQATENSWAQIDVALRRRHDLIPALVEAVKGYAAHERTDVRERHRGAQRRRSPPRARRSARRPRARWARPPSGVLVVAEAYPELEASDNFSKLQSDLRETEDQIAITRRVYNDTVETYNTLIQVFPAGDRRARCSASTRREFFDAPAEAEVAPAGQPLPRPGVIARTR